MRDKGQDDQKDQEPEHALRPEAPYGDFTLCGESGQELPHGTTQTPEQSSAGELNCGVIGPLYLSAILA